MNVPAFASSAEKQSGNVLFVVLLCVALIAGFSCFMARDDKNPRANYDKNDISSLTVMQYSASIGRGIHRMLDKGIALKEIEFYPPIDSSFTDIAETDKAKNLLFHPEGGGVTYYPVDRDAVEKVTRNVSQNQNGNWHFKMLRVKNVGTSKKEMTVLLYRVKPDICKNINLALNGNETIPVIKATGEKFIKGHTRLDGPGFDGVTNTCFRTSDDRHVFYSVLLAR